MAEFNVALGATIRDHVSGFEGVVVGRVQYLTGCNVLLVQPRVSDDAKGDLKDPRWIDEPRAIVLGPGAVTLPNNREQAGRDVLPPTSRSGPARNEYRQVQDRPRT
jgi:hypothetical protein